MDLLRVEHANSGNITNPYTPMRRLLTFRIFLFVTFLIDMSLVMAVLNLPSEYKVWIRNLLFSQIYTDNDIRSEGELNRLLAQEFKEDAVPRSTYRQFLNVPIYEELDSFRQRATDTALARRIAEKISVYTRSRNCGIDGLRNTVFSVERAEGCCSDYSKAFMAYAIALGLEVREVSNGAHTAVEYFDRQGHRWIWIDAFKRSQFSDSEGRLLSQYEIRNSRKTTHLTLQDLPPAVALLELETYDGYTPSEFAGLIWPRGVNLIEQDKAGSTWLTIRLPRELRQLYLFFTGVKPTYLILTTRMTALYMHLAKFFMECSLVLLILLHLFAFARASKAVVIILGRWKYDASEIPRTR